MPGSNLALVAKTGPAADGYFTMLMARNSEHRTMVETPCRAANAANA